jgi:hypothetical protein
MKGNVMRVTDNIEKMTGSPPEITESGLPHMAHS